MFFLDNLLVLVFLCFNFFYAMIVLGKKNNFSLQPYDAHVLFKGLYSDRATKTTEGNYMMLCNSANLMAHENTV